jgi:hypothetical protein
MVFPTGVEGHQAGPQRRVGQTGIAFAVYEQGRPRWRDGEMTMETEAGWN